MVHASTQEQFEKHKERASAKLFTPSMIFWASWLGGLLAGGMLIAANYMAIGQKNNALKTMAWAVGGLILIFVLGQFLPQRLMGAGFTVGIAIGLKYWAKSTFNWDYPKASWWLAILVAILNIVLLVVLWIGISLFSYLALGIGKPEILETYVNPIETRRVVLTRNLVGGSNGDSPGERYAYAYRAEVIGNEQEKRVIVQGHKRPEFTGWIDKETIEYIDGFNRCTASLFSSSQPICKEDADLKKDIMRRAINLDQEEIEAKQAKNPPTYKAASYLKGTQIKQGK